MNRDEQRNLIAEITARIACDIVRKVDECAIPDTWEGCELRAYIAHRFAQENHIKMPARRFEDYRNDIIVNDL